MRFQTPLRPGRLIRRHKRFLADVRLDDGAEVTAHCPNPGSMMGLADPGTRVWLEDVSGPGRRLPFAWRLVDHENGHFTCIDTTLPNRLVRAALARGAVPGIAGEASVEAEVACGPGTRLDFRLRACGGPAAAADAQHVRPETWVEVKSVTLSRRPALAEFPDAVTARGLRHLHRLAQLAEAGARAILLYVVQRTDCAAVAVAADIDPAYAAGLAEARSAGVEVMALGCRIDPSGVALGPPLEVRAQTSARV